MSKHRMRVFWLFVPLAGVLWVPMRGDETTNAHPLFEQGLGLESRGHVFEALQHFEQAMATDPSNLGYREHYAWYCMRRGFHEKALPVFYDLQSKVDDGPRAAIYRGIGFCERQVGRLDKSLEAYGKVYELPPPSGGTGPVFDEIGRKIAAELAVEHTQLAQQLEQNPGDEALQRQLMQVALDQGHVEEGIERGRALWAAHGDDMPLGMMLAEALHRGGEYDEAAALLQQLLQREPDSAYLHYQLGVTYSAMKRGDEAEASLRRSLELHPNVSARKELVKVLAMNGRKDEALAAAPQPDDPEAQALVGRLARAQALHYTGQLQPAQTLYREILDEYPGNAEALRGLTETLVYTGRAAEAADVLSRAGDLGSDASFEHQRKLLALYTAPRAEWRVDYYENSLDFAYFDTSLSIVYSPRYDVRLDGRYRYSHFEQDGFDSIDRHEVFFHAEVQVNEWLSLGGGLGGNVYDTGRETFTAEASLTLKPTDKLTLTAAYQRYDVIDSQTGLGNQIFNQATIGAAALATTADSGSLFAHYHANDRLDLYGKFAYDCLDDGNSRVSGFFEADYILFWEPLVLVGYNYYFLDVDDPAPLFVQNGNSTAAYYDPINFEVHTFILKVSKRLSPRWEAGIEERLSFIPKSDGFANGIFGFVRHDMSDRVAVRLDARYFYQSDSVSRTGTGGDYRAATIGLLFEMRF